MLYKLGRFLQLLGLLIAPAGIAGNIAQRDVVTEGVMLMILAIGGGMFLIGAFALLLLTCLFVAFFAGDQFGLLLVIGVTALIFTHIFQNVGMTISMLPITGVPLPLISYSGSFALMIMFALGIVNSVWVHRHEVGP